MVAPLISSFNLAGVPAGGTIAVIVALVVCGVFALAKGDFMTASPNERRNRAVAATAIVGIVVGGLLIVGASYLGANRNEKSIGPPTSSSVHTGTRSETTGSGNNSR